MAKIHSDYLYNWRETIPLANLKEILANHFSSHSTNRAKLAQNIKKFNVQLFAQNLKEFKTPFAKIIMQISQNYPKRRQYHASISWSSFHYRFLPAIQIQWKLCLAIILLLAIRSQKNFAHAMCHVQNFVAIAVFESKWEWNGISIEFELRWIKR